MCRAAQSPACCCLLLPWDRVCLATCSQHLHRGRPGCAGAPEPGPGRAGFRGRAGLPGNTKPISPHRRQQGKSGIGPKGEPARAGETRALSLGRQRGSEGLCRAEGRGPFVMIKFLQGFSYQRHPKASGRRRGLPHVHPHPQPAFHHASQATRSCTESPGFQDRIAPAPSCHTTADCYLQRADPNTCCVKSPRARDAHTRRPFPGQPCPPAATPVKQDPTPSGDRLGTHRGGRGLTLCKALPGLRRIWWGGGITSGFYPGSVTVVPNLGICFHLNGISPPPPLH